MIYTREQIERTAKQLVEDQCPRAAEVVRQLLKKTDDQAARIAELDAQVQGLQHTALTDARIIEIRQKTNASGDFSPFSDTKAFARAIEAECNAARAATKGGAA